MDKNEELRQEAWKEIETDLGGRYRDGAECPFVYDLFQLAASSSDQPTAPPTDAEAIREHLEVCGVCRMTYQSAVSSLDPTETADDAAADSENSLLAEIADAVAGANQPDDQTSAPSPASIIREEQADVHYQQALLDHGVGQTTAQKRQWNLVVRTDHLVSGNVADWQPTNVTMLATNHQNTTVQFALSGGLIPSDDRCVEVTLIDGNGNAYFQSSLTEKTSQKIECSQMPVDGDELTIVIRDRSTAFELIFKVTVGQTGNEA